MDVLQSIDFAANAVVVVFFCLVVTVLPAVTLCKWLVQRIRRTR